MRLKYKSEKSNNSNNKAISNMRRIFFGKLLPIFIRKEISKTILKSKLFFYLAPF